MGSSSPIKGVKDATPAQKFTPWSGMTFASAKFPDTLAGMPKLGALSQGATRYQNYESTSDSSKSISAVVSKNSGQNDANDMLATKHGIVSYDGGTMICYQGTGKYSCQILLGNSLEIATLNDDGATSTDDAAKAMVEWMGAQK